MSSNKNINSEIIKEVFKTMKYNNETENNVELPKNSNNQTSEEINTYLSNLSKFDKWNNVDNSKRKNFMYKLTSECVKEENTFIELEKKMRNVPSMFVKKKSLPFLITSLHYYSNFCELVKTKQKGMLTCKLGVNSCLSTLGLILGPSLAAGYRILLIVPEELNDLMEFIKSLFDRVGFPEGTICTLPSILPNDVKLDLLFQQSEVVTTFDKKIQKISNKKLMAIRSSSLPIIIFDNADLDSACECVLNSTGKNQLIFNSSPREVFVQETIFKKFVRKIKDAVARDKTNIHKCKPELKPLISKAESNGVEVFPLKFGNECIENVLFIGDRVIDENCSTSVVSIVAFRNIDEAIALANNNTQGLAASIWTENIGLANYVSENLDASNIWINSFGIYSPEISFNPKKFSGKGYFCGIQGFNELLYKVDPVSFEDDKPLSQKNDKLFLDAITLARKGYQTWNNSLRTARIVIFHKVLDYIENNKNKFISKKLTDEWISQWKILFNEYIESSSNMSLSSPFKAFSLNVSYNSKGVLALETTKMIENHNKKLIISSLIEGNALIILNNCEEIEKFYNEISKQFPTGTLSIVPYFKSASSLAHKNPSIDGYFNEYIIEEELDSTNKFTTVSSFWSDIYSKVTYVKNVWSNVGQGLKLK